MINSIQFVEGFVMDLYKNAPKKMHFTDGMNILFSGNGCLKKGTEVSTTDGIKKIEDIKVGDFVFDENGKPIRVLKTFDTGIKKVYDMVSDKKIWASSTLDHVWQINNRHHCRTLKDISECGNKKNNGYNRIRRTIPKYEFSNKKYYKDAYMIGYILGDGCCVQTTKHYHISSQYENSIKYIAENLNSSYHKLIGENYTWEIKRESENELYKKWCHKKHSYEKIVDLDVIKTWDRVSLLSFLAGIVDSDGSIHKHERGNYIFNVSMQSETIIDAVEYCLKVLWSIIPNRYIDNREKYTNGPCYYISVKKKSDMFTMCSELKHYLQVTHKKENADAVKKPVIHDYVAVDIDRESGYDAQTYDIHVDSETNLYCLANGLVTHNSGKSVALKFLKAYCSIQVAGWTSLVDPKVLAPDPFPHAYRAFTPDKDRVVVDWDGTPVFYNSGDIADNNAWFFQKDGVSEDGLSTEKERFDTMIEKPSSGQYRLKKINKLLNIIGNPPELKPNPLFGDVSPQLEYLESLPKGGKTTILLDEPERSLSLPKQKKLLDVLLGFAENHQIIMACHSPFALGLPRDKVNFIEIERNYINECDSLLSFK